MDMSVFLWLRKQRPRFAQNFAGMTDALVSIIDTALVSVDESCEKLLLGSMVWIQDTSG